MEDNKMKDNTMKDKNGMSGWLCLLLLTFLFAASTTPGASAQDKKTAADYRNAILAAGGSKDAADLVEDFLC